MWPSCGRFYNSLQIKLCNDYYGIDCINYFFHREMNLMNLRIMKAEMNPKNRIAHFMKAEGSPRFKHCKNCLFLWSLSSHSRIWPMHARHLWPLSSEGSLTCHTCCDTGLPFIMVISEDPRHSHLLPSVWQCSCHYLFLPHARRTLYLPRRCKYCFLHMIWFKLNGPWLSFYNNKGNKYRFIETLFKLRKSCFDIFGDVLVYNRFEFLCVVEWSCLIAIK